MFKDITEWKDKKLRSVSALFEIIYLILSLAAPIIIIAIKYNLFTIVESKGGKSLNGTLLILLLIFAVLGLRALRKVVNRMPQTTYKQRSCKFLFQTLYAVAIPIMAVVVLLCFKDDFELAYDTFKWCLLSYTLGVIVDKFFISFIEAEKDIRSKADETMAIQHAIMVKKQH